MDEQDGLAALGVCGEWIWGDDSETAVFAQAYGNGNTLMFRFTCSSDDGAESLAARIVKTYHGVAFEAPFSDRPSMRQAIWSTVADIWTECVDRLETRALDAIIDVHGAQCSTGPSAITWNVCHEKLFTDYLSLLRPVSGIALPRKPTLIAFESLTRFHQLGGRGTTTLVHASSLPGSSLVFKGVDFRTYLFSYESGHIDEEVKAFYHSLQLIENMPRHPNIIEPPLALVTVSDKKGAQLVCGTLHEFSPYGTVGSEIQKSNGANKRIAPRTKAQWCYEMVSAVSHTHLVAHTYHMDVKPGNFLIVQDSHLVLIDWEQTDAPVTTAAPEVDGTWDVCHVFTDDQPHLEYTKYSGPERRNMPETTPGENGWNKWNVFPLWSRKCPSALELAEVFSLGRTMWMLLRQPNMDNFEEVTSVDDIVEDWSGCDDLPAHWKQTVDQCLKRDPNCRPRLQQLSDFWIKESLQFSNKDSRP